MTNPTVPDAIGEWWIHPLAVTIPEQDRTITGAISSTGAILACSLDHDTGQTSRHQVGQAPPNDHNCPSLWYQPGHRPVIMWTHHSQERVIHCKVGTRDGNLASLIDAADQEGDSPLSVSYTQLHHVPHLSDGDQDTFWLLSRLTTLSWQMRFLSVDQSTGVVTWQPWKRLMLSAGQCYFSTADAYHPTDQVIRIAWGYNPEQPWSAVRYIELNLTSGELSSPVDTAVSGNIYTDTDVTLHDTNVAPLLPEPAPDHTRRLFYVRPGPATTGVAYAEWERSNPDAAVYKTTVWQGGQWVTREYGTAGPRIGFTPVANYIAGMAFPTPCTDDTVYIARQAGNTATVERTTTRDGRDTTDLLMTDTDRRWIRPAPPVNGEGVIAYEVIHYGTHFTDYHANLHHLTQPVTPDLITTTDRTIRILAGDLRTGQVVMEIPVSSGTWAAEHRTAGTVSAGIPLGALPDRKVTSILAATEGARCFLAAVSGDDVLEAGPIWMHEYAPNTQLLTLKAKGLWSLWDHRIVMGALTPTTANPNPWRSWSTTWQDLSLGTIAKRLIQLAMSHTGGRLPVVLPPDEPGTDRRTYHGYELGVVGERLAQMMDITDGPDIAFEPRFTQDRLTVEWHMRTGDPILSQDGDDWVWDAGPALSTVQESKIRRDWSDLASAAWAVNNSLERSRMMRRATDDRLLQGGFPLLETSSSYDTVRYGAELASNADADLVASSRPWLSVDVSVRADQPPHVGRYRPGDYAQVSLPRDPYLKGLGFTGPVRSRVLRVAGDMGATVNLTLAPTMEAR